MDLEGTSLELTGLTSNGVGAELSGDFAFEQSYGETIVIMDNVSSSVSINESAGTFENGYGAMLVRWSWSGWNS